MNDLFDLIVDFHLDKKNIKSQLWVYIEDKYFKNSNNTKKILPFYINNFLIYLIS